MACRSKARAEDSDSLCKNSFVVAFWSWKLLRKLITSDFSASVEQRRAQPGLPSQQLEVLAVREGQRRSFSLDGG